MINSTNIRERRAIQIALRSAELAHVDIRETIGAAWLSTHESHEIIPPKRRELIAKSIASDLEHDVEEVDVIPQISSFTYFDQQLEILHRKKLYNQVEVAMSGISPIRIAAFKHKIDFECTGFSRKQLADLLNISYGKLTALCSRWMIDGTRNIIKRNLRDPEYNYRYLYDYQPDIDSTSSIL